MTAKPIRSLDDLTARFEAGGVQALEALLPATPPTDAWLGRLIEGLSDPRHSVPASWMIRAYLQAGLEPSAARTAGFVRALARLAADDARLHACQCIQHLDVPKRNAEQLARFLRSGVAGAHKFTRAWAVDAFHRLARQHPRYAGEAAACLERALVDPAASVRARARHVAKERGF